MMNTTGSATSAPGKNEGSGQSSSSSASNDQFAIEVPQVNLPKGGGALKNIDEKFKVNAANGTSSFSIPLSFSKTRSDFSPAISLNYNSGSGNGPFGLGWNMETVCIQRKTDKQLPQYRDALESDIFMISGMEDLVPSLKKDENDNWIPEVLMVPGEGQVYRYLPRVEGGFSRIEKIIPAGSNIFFWRVTTGDNTVTIFGKEAAARVADPNDPTRIFKWLPEISYDDRGNCLEYEYVAENFVNVPSSPSEQNRFNNNAPCTNKYLKRIKYGNKNPYQPGASPYNPALPVNPDYLFEAVFDYGDHDENDPLPSIQHGWPFRYDPFSNYHPGFEVRTYRLCRRILFFHYFAELSPGTGITACLVRSLDISYKLFCNPAAPAPAIRNAETDYIISIQHSGYIRKNDGTYSRKSLPPVDFTYQELQWNKEVQTVSAENIIHDPVGLGTNYQWTDLWNEGISGILTEQSDAWFYKSNLGDGNFSIAEPVIPKPSFSGINKNILRLQELEADGRKYMVSLQPEAKGFFEISDENEWQPFRSFEKMPNVDFNDPNTKFIDLDGDGRPELVISEENVFTWYPSRGIAGYDSPELAAKPFDEEKGPALLFNDATQSIFLAGMSGDGLTDIVRVRNGEICYWPNLGYGKFGAKVNMNFAPVFDTPDQFNPAFLKLADISGTGATDILYLGQDKFKAWINLNGNGWSELQEIDPFPSTVSPVQLTVIDFLGNGTGCIVWSSPLPADTNAPLRYIDLMGGKKPYIMSGYKNNFGKEISWEYKSSTYFYLADKKAGKPWVTTLPVPVQCVAKVRMNDIPGGNFFTNEYSYHHGYYDHAEREFRGFGRVEQTDTEEFDSFKLSGAGNAFEPDLHQSPVKTITWFHTGAWISQEKILNQFEHEYNQGLFEFTLPKPVLPAGLTPAECREALRACKSMALRQEVYAIDGSAMEGFPYSVSTHNNIIKLLQPQQQNQHAVFYVHESEAVNFVYERNPADPRITHTLNLEVDDRGNVLKSASIAYGRKTNGPSLPPEIRQEQSRQHVVFAENNFTNDFNLPAIYRLKAAAETKTYELTNNAYATVPQFSIGDLLNDFSQAVTIAYEDQPDGSLQKRIIEQARNIYVSNDLVTPLQPGQIDTLGFKYQSYKLALTASLVDSLYSGRLSASMLTDAGYVQADGQNWWISSGRTIWLDQGENLNDARSRFYLPVAVKDPLDTETRITYDNYRLLITAVEDAIQNRMSVEIIDYRTLSPLKLKDANDNISEVVTDELGMVIAASVYGNEEDGLHGDASLDTYNKIEAPALADVIADPHTYLQRAGSFYYYDLFAWMQRTQPVSFTSIVRETHVSELNEGEPTQLFLTVGYSNGLGKSLQNKVQAEPGKALKWENNSLITVDTTPGIRWVGNGRTIFNNKGNPVKQYEPFFSTTYEYEPDQALVEIGVSSLLYYDAPGRVIKAVHANGTLARTEFDAWKQLSFDENDTVLESTWYSDRGSPAPAGAEPADPGTRAAWLTAKHANTPKQLHLDSLGRPVYSLSDNGTEGKYSSRTIMDIENNKLQAIDARNNTVMRYRYDMISRQVYQQSMDSSERWTFRDSMNKPAYAWDSRNHRFKTEFDILQRPLKNWLKEDVTDAVPEKLVGLNVYGEGQPNDRLRKLRGKVFRLFDASGMTETSATDFKGNVKESHKQLTKEVGQVIDWNVPDPFSLLETEIFNSSSRFDAVGRPVEMVLPDNSKVLPSYNEANLLKKVDVFIQSRNDTINFVRNINYNAKAQREQILYGNNTATRYTYDPKTYRLAQLRTTRNGGSDVLQDISYTYDPVGNITTIHDAAQQTIFFNNAGVDPENNFEYNAVYRLIKGSGREHAGQSLPCDQFDSDKAGFNNQRLAMPGDMNAMQRYEQRFEYDETGNMLRMIHNAGNGIFSNKWTRQFTYAVDSNRLLQTQTGADTTIFNYDVHGNMENLGNGSFDLIWNYADHLEQVDLGGGGMASYVYDSSGQRVRKVIRNGNMTKERIYLNGYEIYREKMNGVPTLQRETLHVMDDKKRIALVETRTQGNDPGLPFLVRYQYNNHLDTAMLETDDQASIISYEEYYPFGSTSYKATRNQTDTAGRYRYTGKERDEETGLYYHGARYYAPWLARWTAADPIGIGDGLNVYAYALNSPVILHDPDGRDSKPKGAQQDITWRTDAQLHDFIKGLTKAERGKLMDEATGPARDRALKMAEKSKLPIEFNRTLETDTVTATKPRTDKTEDIVVVGSAPVDKEHSLHSRSMFYNAALADMIKDDSHPDKKTMIVFKETYSVEQRDIMEKQVTDAGGTFKVVESRQEFINYLNDNRDDMAIGRLDIFSHGRPGKFMFGWEGSEEANYELNQTHVSKISPKAFQPDATIKSFACRTFATSDLEGNGFDPPIKGESLAETLKKHLFIHIEGSERRIDYANIHGTDDQRHNNDSVKEHNKKAVGIDGSDYNPGGSFFEPRPGDTPWAASPGWKRN